MNPQMAQFVDDHIVDESYGHTNKIDIQSEGS